jgi:hypothetical protein
MAARQFAEISIDLKSRGRFFSLLLPVILTPFSFVLPVIYTPFSFFLLSFLLHFSFVLHVIFTPFSFVLPVNFTPSSLVFPVIFILFSYVLPVLSFSSVSPLCLTCLFLFYTFSYFCSSVFPFFFIAILLPFLSLLCPSIVFFPGLSIFSIFLSYFHPVFTLLFSDLSAFLPFYAFFGHGSIKLKADTFGGQWE